MFARGAGDADEEADEDAGVGASILAAIETGALLFWWLLLVWLRSFGLC